MITNAQQFVLGLIRHYVITKGIEIMSTPDQDVQTAVAAFQKFLADLAALLPTLVAALAAQPNVSQADIQALDAVVGQVAPLQAQYDALIPPPPAS